MELRKGISNNITKLGVLVILIAITPNLLFSCTVKKEESNVTIAEKASVVQDKELAVNAIHSELDDEKQAGDTLCVFQEPELEPEQVFLYVEQMPKFADGDAALIKHINQNMQYPENALKNNVQGVVIVKFVVTKSGTMGAVEIVRGVDAELDAEALRLVKSLPNSFIPGRFNGEAVNVWYTLPVSFILPLVR